MENHGFVVETGKDGRGRNPAASELIDLPKSAPDKFQERAVQILEDCKAFIVDSPETFSNADKIISHGASLIKGIKFVWDPVCKAANDSHKLATSTRKKLIDPVDQGTRLLAQKMGAYKRAEDERIAAEQKAIEDKAKRDQEQAVQEQVKEMEKQKASPAVIEAVKEMANAPVIVPQVPVQQLRSKTGFTIDWAIKVIDKALVPDSFKTVNESAILAAVRGSKGEFTLPGIRVTQTTKTTRRAAK